MISVPTTLVLGAGASMPYGYPSGRGLVNRIVAGIESKLWKQIVWDCGIEEKTRAEFRQLLRTAETDSIDSWLAFQPDFSRVGKLAIALALFDCEIESNLHNRDGCAGIYHQLLDQMYIAPQDFFENRLRIVTFNYDRSLEQFLYTTLRSRYAGTADLIKGMAESIPIQHVHGYLGPLPWQGQSGRAYGPILDYPWGATHQERQARNQRAREVQDASEGIVVMQGGGDENARFEPAIGLLEEAKRIYFMGFSFHPDNVGHLKPERWAGGGRAVLGTCQGIPASRQGSLGGELGITLLQSTVDALEFVRGYADWS